MKKSGLLFLALLALSYSYAQQPDNVNWSAQFAASQKSFSENKGQFDGRNNLPGTEILFAAENQPVQILFTKQGLTYRFDKRYRNPNRRKGDTTKPKYLLQTEFVHVTWEGANPATAIVAEEETGNQNIYSLLSAGGNSYHAIENVKGYKRLVYKNLYPNIDAEYIFHPQSGIKYSLIAHPGADISQVKMKYSQEKDMSIDETGSLRIATSFGDILEHPPVTFYADGNKEIIPSKFMVNGKTVSFDFGNYDHSKSIVIDPWVQLPILANSNSVWECEVDSSGNVYIIGGDVPMRLQKYNSSGVLQWTYNTPWDTTDNWLGTIATDLLGNSYITSGSNAAMQKINSNGNLIWSINSSLFPSDEYWSIAFNCDQTKMMVGGTRLSQFPPAGSHGVIFTINTLNGSITDSTFVSGTRPGSPINDINEVRAITASANSKYYFLTLDTIGCVQQNPGACSGEKLFAVNSTYDFAYKSEFFRPNNGNSGICAIRANDRFVYTQNGIVIHKRSLVTGSIIDSADIPGGINTVVSFSGFNQPGNSGIAIDSCGNVYAGSADRVLKFDADLNIMDSVMLPFRVFDIAVNNNGEIIVAGTTGNSSSIPRTGYVQSINMSACQPFSITSCCNASICAAGPFYVNDTAITLTPATSGGMWSGPGITNAVTGEFDPFDAGLGTHTIIYAISCGSDSMLITVKNPLYVCITTDTQLVVSNGTPPYLWQQRDTVWDCSSCFNGVCGVPTGCTQIINTWITISTDSLSAFPDSFPLRVSDSLGNELIFNDSSELFPCPDPSRILVWPGDADDNLFTNIFDIFPIALHHGSTGNARDSVSNLWLAHACITWNQNSFMGSDLAHADCNGDGIIDGNDRDAINLNYGLTHSRKHSTINSRAGEPPLFLLADKSLYQPGDTVTIEIHAGNSTLPVNEIYGIAVRLAFDNSVVEPGTMEFVYPDSYMGIVSNNLQLDKISELSGEADGAICRKNHLDANGYGVVAALKFIAKNTSGFPVQTTFSFTDYLVLNATADSVLFDLQNSSAQFLVDGATGILYTSEDNRLKIYPNPFDKILTIEYALAQNSDVSLKIYDVLGKVIMDKPLTTQGQGVHRVLFENDNAGKSVFFVQLTVDGEQIMRKIVQMK